MIINIDYLLGGRLSPWTVSTTMVEVVGSVSAGGKDTGGTLLRVPGILALVYNYHCPP
jgi:hypothetical protein